MNPFNLDLKNKGQTGAETIKEYLQAIEAKINEIINKNIITAKISESHNITTLEAEQLVLIENFKNGSEFSVSNGGVKIGTGINKVEVSATVTFATQLNANDLIYIYIYKNNSLIEMAQCRTSTPSTMLNISPVLTEVNKNDIIYLKVKNNTNKSGLINNHTFMTVEEI